MRSSEDSNSPSASILLAPRHSNLKRRRLIEFTFNFLDFDYDIELCDINLNYAFVLFVLHFSMKISSFCS